MKIRHKQAGVELEVRGLARFTPPDGRTPYFAAGDDLNSRPRSIYSLAEWETVPPDYLKGDVHEKSESR